MSKNKSKQEYEKELTAKHGYRQGLNRALEIIDKEEYNVDQAIIKIMEELENEQDHKG